MLIGMQEAVLDIIVNPDGDGWYDTRVNNTSTNRVRNRNKFYITPGEYCTWSFPGGAIAKEKNFLGISEIFNYAQQKPDGSFKLWWIARFFDLLIQDCGSNNFKKEPFHYRAWASPTNKPLIPYTQTATKPWPNIGYVTSVPNPVPVISTVILSRVPVYDVTVTNTIVSTVLLPLATGRS
jgi:hypothetical protein